MSSRQEKLQTIAGKLALPYKLLHAQYELYIQTDKELDRWSSKAAPLQDRLFQRAPTTARLVMEAPSNYLPAVIDELLKSDAPAPV